MRRPDAVFARRMKVEWEADERPEPRSLGLLPSGPDPVGEWLVHRQPPASISAERNENASGRRAWSTAGGQWAREFSTLLRRGASREQLSEKRRDQRKAIVPLRAHPGRKQKPVDDARPSAGAAVIAAAAAVACRDGGVACHPLLCERRRPAGEFHVPSPRPRPQAASRLYRQLDRARGRAAGGRGRARGAGE